MLRLTGFAVTLLAVAACSGATETAPGPTGTQSVIRTKLPRALSAAETKVVSSANAFSFALFQQVSGAEPNANVFISPLSASFSLGMTLNGARNGTFNAMRTALQAGSASQSEINAGYRGLIDVLDSLDDAVSFTIANSIWYRNGLPVNRLFLDAGRTFFDGTVSGLDFDDEASSIAAINSWVNDKTNGKIPSIVDQIDRLQEMSLINAIYFKGSWRSKFDPTGTVSAPFTPATGAVQQAQMMTLDDSMRYASVDGMEVIELPYGNKSFSMVVVVPPTSTTLDAFVATLDESSWQALLAALRPRKWPLHFPKLRLSYERTLDPDLTALGMGVAFTGPADFTGMSSEVGVSLDFVKQKTFIDINEEGTEAAAITESWSVSEGLERPIEVNRPYLIAIRERLTGTIIFLGKINRMQ